MVEHIFLSVEEYIHNVISLQIKVLLIILKIKCYEIRILLGLIIEMIEG